MDAATIAAGLDRSQKTASGWQACCPAHDDKSPSLSISDGENGKILVHCHANCPQADVVAALKARGLWPEAPPKKKRRKPRSQIKDTYNYVDEHGKLQYQVVRMDPKDFRQRQPDGDGGWIWSLTGVDHVLYNLPGILSTKSGVVIVEGEKDANALIKLGIVATTCAGGAGRWKPGYTRHLAGRHVFIIPDNDEPGRKHAEQIAAQLHGTAKNVKIVNLPDLPPKGDVSDWLASGGNKKSLAELIDAAPDWIPPTDSPADPGPPPEPHETPSQPACEAQLDTPPDTPPQGENGSWARTGALAGEWASELVWKRDRDGNPTTLESLVVNAQLMLSYHPDMRDVLAYNEFTKTVEIARRPPWDSENRARPVTYPRKITDVDDTRATAFLERLQIKLSISVVHQALVSAAHHNPYNPLQQYLDALMWDGKPRLDTALIRYFGAPDNEYTRAVSRKYLIGAVARALNPGCQMDTMLILEGPQGLKKSTAVAALFGTEWFTDELGDLGSKDSGMQVQGVWAVEMAELSTLSRAEAARIKEWISRKVDRFRPPWGRNVVEAPRQCVLVGTVNPEGGYLRDSTGGRRFWPIRCSNIDVDLIRSERDQLWAEATDAYLAHERWWFDPHERHIAENEQADRYESDVWTDAIAEQLLGKEWATVHEIMKGIDLPTGQQTYQNQQRVARTLVALGWTRVRQRRDGKQVYGYVRDGGKGGT